MADSERRRPTMQDVAERAGVSRASVSLTFRGAPGVGEATRQRILATAREMGYVLDESARGLRAAGPTNIGVCFDTRQPFQLEVVDGLYRATNGSGHQVLLSGRSQHRSEEDAVSSLLGFRSGVVVLISSLMSERALSELAARVPVISVGRRLRTPDVSWVASDDLAGMNAALGHLRELGHRDIVYLSSESAPAGRDRLRAFRSAAESHGMADRVRVLEGGMDELSGVVAAEALLAAGELPTAVIGFNDRCALGVLQVLLRNGVRVPEEVSIIGFDDSEVAANRPVSMTSIRQEPDRIASLAIERALDVLTPSDGRSRPRGTLVPTSLTIRDTTGPARE